MSDQQIGAKPDQLPEYKDHDQIICQGDPEHGEHENGESTEVTGTGGIIRHVSETEHMNQEPNKCDDEKKQAGGASSKNPNFNSQPPFRTRLYPS